MSEFLKVSGKEFALPREREGWTYTVRPGGWIIAESPSGERKRFALWQGKGKLSASIHGRLYYGEVAQERKGHGTSASGGDADLTAQFPGKVRKILVAAGAQLEEGAPMILVEAMKMEFTIKAPFAGTVKRVLVTEGQQLSPGDQFFEFVELGNGEGAADGG